MSRVAPKSSVDYKSIVDPRPFSASRTRCSSPDLSALLQVLFCGRSSKFAPEYFSTRRSNSMEDAHQAMEITFPLLEEITNDFSKERIIGQGVCAIVYLGVRKNGERIAVKRLHDMVGIDDEQFRKVVVNHMKMKHQNIVQFVGYCSETRRIFVEYEGRRVLAGRINQAFCFEYMSNGNLRNHISDDSVGLNWHTRYKIIKGVSEGLKYLHEGLEHPIYHLNISLRNILLDRKMVPKLAGFSDSRSFAEEQTIITESNVGTLVYLPPEYVERHIVSKKFDIFGLGIVIIQIMAGRDGPRRSDKMSPEQFVELVHNNWRNRLQGELSRLGSLEACCEQVKTCMEIALSCVEPDRHKRPTIGDIVHKLNETETTIDEVASFSSELGPPVGQISSVSELVHQVKSMAVSAPPSQVPPSGNNQTFEQEKEACDLQRVSEPNGPEDTKYEFYDDDDGPSLSSSISSGPPSEMVDLASEREALERILDDTRAEPTKLSYILLQSITNNFRTIIGRGGFAFVYQGVLPNGGKVAVKKLFIPHDFSDDVFVDEIKCLIKAKHNNVVRFLGYCSTTQGELMEFNGIPVMADVPKRLLCFEYIPNGSLHRYLKEKSHGDEWQIRYQMIKGICLGLRYLHDIRINHLDLKPGNILLDVHMKPKIADFGLSRCFDEGQTRIFTKNKSGTPGYIAPEIIDGGEISFKSDIFALGIIIIKLLMGRNHYDIEKWHESLNMDCPQVRTCTEIAQACLDNNQHKRPTIGEIVHKLDEVDTIIEPPSID